MIPAAEIGPTLAHEHLYGDLSICSGRRDNILTDAGLAIRELEFFRQAGGRTIVEVTPAQIEAMLVTAPQKLLAVR